MKKIYFTTTRYIRSFFLALLVLLSNSCATILNSTTQDVIVNTGQPDAVVYVDENKEFTGEKGSVTLKRNLKPKQIKVQRDGFEDEYYVMNQAYRSPLYIMSWVPFGVIWLLPPLFDNGQTAFDYPDESRVFECNIPYSEKKEDEKYIFVENVSLNVKPKDFGFSSYKLREYIESSDRNQLIKYSPSLFISRLSLSSDLKVENTTFDSYFNELLRERNFIDTTKNLLKNNLNTVFADAEINAMNFFIAERNIGTIQISLFFAELEITWKILDIYKNILYEDVLKVRSGEFPWDDDFMGDPNNESLIKATEDAMRRSFMKLLASKEMSSIKKIEENNIDFDELEMTYSNNGVEVNELQSAIKACVTIKTDKGHGSGFFISDDGYVLTNYHVVAGAKEIKIITNDQDEFDVKLVRKNLFDDLALLKFDGKVPVTFNITNFKKGVVGQDIFAIGTPSSMELTQTLSKGIISGHRKVGENKVYQTDASINSGNSGGPLVSKDGKLIGVVNAKVVGKGVEGIGFAIPIERVLKGLNVK